MSDHSSAPRPLILEPVDPGSSEQIEAVYDIRRRLEIVCWLDDEPWEPFTDPQQAVDLLDRRRAEERADPHQRFRLIRDPESGQVVGHASVKRLVRHEGGFVGEYEIGWTLRPGTRGHGYATRAGAQLAREAFGGGLEELVIEMWADNDPSAAVARRLGAQEIGVMDSPWYTGVTRVFHLRPEHLLAEHTGAAAGEVPPRTQRRRAH